MKQKELVWREIIDVAITRSERRRRNNQELAFRAGVPSATAAYALRRLIEIGAVHKHSAGFTVVNPGKVLTMLCAARSVVSDAHAVVAATSPSLEHFLAPLQRGDFFIGGAAAAIELLGGTNTVSDYSEHVIYLRSHKAAAALDETLVGMGLEQHSERDRARGNVTFLVADRRAARTWQGHSSFAQTYADIFATPGWQASEFRLALNESFLRERDWEQR